MKQMGVEANIVALSGIAIAIGVMVDVGIVFIGSILRYMDEERAKGIESRGKAFISLITKAVSEVSGALSTAMLTTIISFLPVFMIEAQEGKLFKPLAYTKTFALTSAFILGIIVLPTLAYYVYSIRLNGKKLRKFANYFLVVAGIGLWIYSGFFVAFALTLIGINNLFTPNWKGEKLANYLNVAITLFMALYYLTVEWLPLGTQ